MGVTFNHDYIITRMLWRIRWTIFSLIGRKDLMADSY